VRSTRRSSSVARPALLFFIRVHFRLVHILQTIKKSGAKTTVLHR
jgi:hypothetical protein